MKKMLISGAGGFVGARVREMYRETWQVEAFPSGMLREADEQAVLEVIRQVWPDVIVHAAAVSDVTESEQYPERSFRANVLLAEWMAKGAAQTGAKLLSFSSDQVYTGCAFAGPYREAQANPGNTYGRHKLEGELRALEICPDAVCLRATWMYDLPGWNLGVRGNLAMNLLRGALANRPMRFSTREVRSVTYVRQVAQLLEQAAELPGGSYNFGSENTLSMYETARVFLRELGLGSRADELILPDEQGTDRGLAVSGEKLRACGVSFDTTAEGIARLARDYRLHR